MAGAVMRWVHADEVSDEFMSGDGYTNEDKKTIRFTDREINGKQHKGSQRMREAEENGA